MSENSIKIKGVRVNNLKNISLEIPRGKFIVITGVSGSGKSSLAFDTIFAEGQRRYVESLSSFARQFLGRISKPDVDEITGIPPAIAIEQKVNTSNTRSTVGTVTEIYDYLRLLYARIGKTYSPVTGREVKRDTLGDILNYIYSMDEGAPVYILAPIGWEQTGERTERLLALKAEGFSRLYNDGNIVKIEDALTGEFNNNDGAVFLLVDRVILEAESEELRERLIDSVQTAMDVKYSPGGDRGVVLISGGRSGGNPVRFSTLFEADGIKFEEPTELLFSFNNPVGACPVCSGFGKRPGIDESLVIPDTSLTIYQEAIACWRGDAMKQFNDRLTENAYKFNFPIHRPYRELTREQKDLLWRGNSYFTGLDEFFELLDSKKYNKIQYRYLKARYSGWSNCPECSGRRLRKEAMYVKIGGCSIDELLEMSIERLALFFRDLELPEYDRKVAARIIEEIIKRLSSLISVGLSYLTLNRPARSLSGGESQRINLVSSIGSSLVGSLYILDEPSIGLHPRDTKRLISVLKQLRDLGNTIIVVEHDEEIMRESDQIIDIGPDAGLHGGEIVYQGPPEWKGSSSDWPRSHTLAYLSGKEKIDLPLSRRDWTGYIEIRGAAEHNLKNINVKFPLKTLTAVTGVSGSGKSSLVREILYPALNRKINQYGEKPGEFLELAGDLKKLTAIEYIDQNPIGKSSRSNPATYLKVYDEVRRLFSEQPYAKANGYGHSHFSFNIDGGRCPECQGDGVISIEMQFMADVKMVCEACGGARFKPDILEVKYRGKNISDVLKMSVEEAICFFSSSDESLAGRIVEKLKPLEAVGLSYVQLGQSSSTLSGGESQRVKLASFLGKEQGGKSIMFIFDEPTTGLHFNDIRKLIDSLNALIDKGHTVVVVEHNMDVVKCADWVIDLGPEGGDRGGQVIFEGRPEELVHREESYTGRALRERMISGR
jgi:excinuclease ABC subunit A